jgi:hypothetical protein
MGDGTIKPSQVKVADLRTVQRDALRFLSLQQISAIDDALTAVGDYGEVRLVKNGGKLRFIQMLRSQVFKEEQ